MLKAKLINLIKLTNTTLEEYYFYKYGGSIRQVIPSEMVSGISILTNMAIALATGLILGMFIVFARYYWKITEMTKKDNLHKVENSSQIKD